MKFISTRRDNPFDNPLLACFVHTLVIIVACTTVYYFLAENTVVPVFLGGAAILVIESMWLYFRLRR